MNMCIYSTSEIHLGVNDGQKNTTQIYNPFFRVGIRQKQEWNPMQGHILYFKPEDKIHHIYPKILNTPNLKQI